MSTSKMCLCENEKKWYEYTIHSGMGRGCPGVQSSNRGNSAPMYIMAPMAYEYGTYGNFRPLEALHSTQRVGTINLFLSDAVNKFIILPINLLIYFAKIARVYYYIPCGVCAESFKVNYKCYIDVLASPPRTVQEK